MKADGCLFKMYQHSTSRGVQRCKRPTVDDLFCQRHVSTPQAEEFRAHLEAAGGRNPQGELTQPGAGGMVCT